MIRAGAHRKAIFILRNSTRQLRGRARNPFNDTMRGNTREPRLELRPHRLVARPHEGLRIESTFEDVVEKTHLLFLGASVKYASSAAIPTTAMSADCFTAAASSPRPFIPQPHLREPSLKD